MKHSTLSLSPIRTHGKFADAAYEAIRTGIRMGRIPPGTRLHEADLADQLGISTTPVREALGRLVADGLATTSGRTGVYVARLSNEEIVDLYEAREIIEPPLARLAGERASDAGVAALQQSRKEFQTALQDDDVDSLMELDSQFHEMLASIAGNRALAEARERLDNYIAIARVASVLRSHRRTSPLALKEHTQICDAVAAHNGRKAERHMSEHIRRRREGLIGKVDSARREGGDGATRRVSEAPAGGGAR